LSQQFEAITKVVILSITNRIVLNNFKCETFGGTRFSPIVFAITIVYLTNAVAPDTAFLP
jgi:uncharacterized membrane protein YvlD (DUF360 family)